MMKEVYIRLDGAVADIVTQLNICFNCFTTRIYGPRHTADTLYGRSTLSDNRKATLRMIMVQPEPFHDMIIFPGIRTAISNLKKSNYRVVVYSDKVQKKVKEEWMEANDMTPQKGGYDYFVWIETSKLIAEPHPDRVIVGTPFTVPRRHDFANVVYFMGYAKGGLPTLLWQPALWSWENACDVI